MPRNTTAAKAAVPVMTVAERLGFEASVALDKTNPVVRGWDAGNSEPVQEAITAYNEAQRLRVEAAALHLLRL